jgi:hypothetical protein
MDELSSGDNKNLARVIGIFLLGLNSYFTSRYFFIFFVFTFSREILIKASKRLGS